MGRLTSTARTGGSWGDTIERSVIDHGASRGRAAVLAATALLCFVTTYLFLVTTADGQSIDAASLGSLSPLRGESSLVVYQARDALMLGLLALAAVASIGALVKRRWSAFGAVAVLLGGSALLTSTLREWAPRPYLGDYAYLHNTFPSGHATMSFAALVAIVWLAPRWANGPVVGILAVVVWVVAAMSLLSFAHRASDPVGGLLLASSIAFGVAALAPIPLSRPTVRRRAAWVSGVIMVAVAVALTVIGLVVPTTSMDLIGLAALAAYAGILSAVLAQITGILLPQTSGRLP